MADLKNKREKSEDEGESDDETNGMEVGDASPQADTRQETETDSVEESLLTCETLDRSSPDLWPRQKRAVGERGCQSWVAYLTSTLREKMLELSGAPVRCLRPETVAVLGRGLDARKVLPSERGKCRDWKGLVDAANFPKELVSNANASPSPTRVLIDHWKKAPLEEANLHQLTQILADIDRYDVLDDVTPLLEADASHFFESRKTESYQIDVYNPPQIGLDDQNILTTHDAMLSRQGSSTYQTYDAFVLFADEDCEFAGELIRRMEDYGLKMCCREHLVIGNLEHTSILTLIAERCTRLIVIISPDFIQSPANKFFIDFAQVLAIQKQQRKIVPCIYKRCNPDLLPPSLKNLFSLNYLHSGALFNFWEKLRDSLRTTPLPITYAQRAVCNQESYPSSLSVTSNSTHSRVPRIEYPASEASECAEPKPSKLTVNLYESNNSLTVPEKVLSKSVDDLTLANPQNGQTSNSLSISSISISVCESDTVSNEHVKSGKVPKSKWFPKIPKFFYPNSSRNIEMCNQNPKVHKQKKKWSRKKPVPLSAT